MGKICWEVKVGENMTQIIKSDLTYESSGMIDQYHSCTGIKKLFIGIKK